MSKLKKKIQITKDLLLKEESRSYVNFNGPLVDTLIRILKELIFELALKEKKSWALKREALYKKLVKDIENKACK